MINFRLARLKLTAWYVTIIALISILFSIIIYRDISSELHRTYTAFQYSIQSPQGLFILNQDLEKALNLVIFRLLVVNGVIIIGSAIAAYFLAGKSLRPLEQGLEKQKQFIADASHELKTPLTALRSEIEVTLKQKTINTKQAKQILKSNLEEVIKMQNLTNYLLLLSRYEEPSPQIKIDQVDIKKTILSAIEKHKIILKTKKIKLETYLDNISITGVETSIAELISILLDNAIKYSEENKKIVIKTKIRRSDIIISISDQGIGIRQSELNYIFNRFYKGTAFASSAYRSDISRNSEGYGLGLSIAQSIVKMHNGTIGVKSELGKGSTFSVVLPRG